MAKPKSDETSPKKTDSTEEPSMYDSAPETAPRRVRFVHWALAAGTMALALSYFVMSSDEQPGEVPPPPEAAAEAAPAPAQDVLNQEMNPAAAPGQPVADTATAQPAEAAATAAPPATDAMDMNAQPPAPPAAEVPAPPQPVAEEISPPAPVAEANPEPPPPPPVAVKKSAKKAEKTKPAKKPTLVFSRAATKVPKGLKKDKVLSYLSKKLDGDKTCIPADTKKKPFTVIANFSKNGTLTAVTTQPKLAKSVSTCIKKKISGNPSLFKSKSTSRLTIALKIK